MTLPLEAVPNFSEGRDEAAIKAIGRAIAERARLLDVHVDADHNRSVFTLVGDDREIVDALLAAIAVARKRIDLREHQGVHPRIGAADVVPIVPIRPADAARAQAVRAGSAAASVRSSASPSSSMPTAATGAGRPSSVAAAPTSCSGGSTQAR